MYGIIYVAIKDYAETTFSADTWKDIVAESGLSINFNSTEQPYKEDIIICFAKAMATVTNTPVNECLYGFGYQIAKTTSEKYPEVMLSRGDSLQEYLLNLPAFHNRISLIYPELHAPEFRVAESSDGVMVMEYLFTEDEFAPYVHGYLTGLSRYFNAQAKVTAVPATSSARHLAFKISW